VSVVDQIIGEVEDSYCGTPPRALPSIVLPLALGAFASHLEEGDLQAAILQELGKLASRPSMVLIQERRLPAPIRVCIGQLIDIGEFAKKCAIGVDG
jgi:hypothetical protein